MNSVVSAAEERPRETRRKRVLFRLLAVLLPGLSLVALELICLFAGWGLTEISEDPFVEFSEIRPLFEKSADGASWQTSPARKRYFRVDSFSAEKPANEFRIFVFGGSTVQGNPFSIETSFPAYLQIALTKANPTRSWEVVNCGGVSYASYRLVPVMQECLAYQPDLFIFCEGHNEFLEDVSYAPIKNAPAAVSTLFGQLNRLRTFRLMRSAVLRFTHQGSTERSNPQGDARPVLTTDVDTLLDHDGGFAVYHRDDEHAAAVASHFRANLQRMVELCEQHTVPLMMILPPSNLSDCPPFKSEFSDSTTVSVRSQIADQLKQARQMAASRPREALTVVEQITSLDPRYALAWYELGHLQLAVRDDMAAERSFRRARDEDVCPLRMTTPLETVMQEVVQQNSLPFLNAHQLLAAKTSTGIIGDNALVDHVHPSFGSHEDIALAVADGMIAAGLSSVENKDWKAATRTECQLRLQSLDNLYFLRGQRHLENLKLWATGRSGGPPLRRAGENAPPSENTSTQK